MPRDGVKQFSAAMARVLAIPLGRPVGGDRTALSGTYDIRLHAAPPSGLTISGGS